MPFAEGAHGVVRGVEGRNDRAAAFPRGEIADEKKAGNRRFVAVAEYGCMAVEVDADRLEEVVGRGAAEREDDVVEGLGLRVAGREADARPAVVALEAGDVRAGADGHTAPLLAGREPRAVDVVHSMEVGTAVTPARAA